MSSSGDATVPATRKLRKSIGGQISSAKATEKENVTLDLGSSSLAANRKKSRSKSIGPGGLDVLKNANGNRRASLAAPSRPPPRSILKPAIAPLPEIPPLKRQGSGPPKIDTPPSAHVSQQDASSGAKVALRTEEEQQAKARQREERERREARRKSLANRRVSFAAEATLHTFHEIDFMQEASRDSSRRASSKPSTNDKASSRSRTPQEQVGDLVPESPEDQRDAHQRKRRRSSTLPAANYGDNDDATIASSIYSSDSEPADAVEEIQDDEQEEDSNSDDDSDVDDGTMMTVEDHEVTGASVMSAMSGRSGSSTGDSDTLEEALRMAARTAGTQKLGLDDSEGEEEVIPSFGWIKKNSDKSDAPQDQKHAGQESPSPPADNDDEDDGAMDMDMEMTQAMGGILPSPDDEQDDGELDMSMDVTRAIGGILSQPRNETAIPYEHGEEGEETMQMDETMEVTKALGGILRSVPDLEPDENEDMSMEFTTAIGGLIPARNTNQTTAPRRRTMTSANSKNLDDATMDMDMTVGVGRILPSATGAQGQDDGNATVGMDMTIGVGRILPAASNDENNVEQDQTMGMDITAAMGSILKGPHVPESRSEAKKFMEEEVDKPESPSKAGSIGRSSTQHAASRDSNTAILTHENHAKPAEVDRAVASESEVEIGLGRSRLPDSKPATPSPVKSAKKNLDVFQQDPSTGARTPLVVLTPQTRRLSGVGADRAGLGSPKVAAIFDRRESLSDATQAFVPGQNRGVSFANPRVMEFEVDNDREEEEEKENQRKILEREVDGQDDREATLNLKEMIQSMSPMRKPLKGRKSLHVGSAKGLLGKRPFELSDDEEAEEDDGVKRLKNHQGSPVKNVRLQQPPSKAETTGRRSLRSSQKSLEDSTQEYQTPTLAVLSSRNGSNATTPRGQTRFKDIEDDTATHPMDFERSPVKDESSLQTDQDEDRIHLQEFLNMTSIRFMELTTTKRRHTQAPEAFKDGLIDDEGNFPLERCVVAGACTVPMLELYQHSCRELKKYISEGRRIVREIETETFEDNPPLFREYMSATPEIKNVLDNQFKNGKSHARLESKAMWYAWRTALQEGLKEGLIRIAEGMDADDKVLEKQQKLLSSILPSLISRFEVLNEERTNLEAVAQELADCDPSELEAVRSELTDVDSDMEKRTKQIVQLRAQLEESEATVGQLTARKRAWQEEIEEAEKIREECRGWSTSEISTLKARVDAIEKQHGWAISGIADSTVSMTYRRSIELVFDISAFDNTQGKNSQIDLWYIATNGDGSPRTSSVEQEFFVQCIRDHVRGLPQSRTKIVDLLHVIRAAWDRAVSTCDDIRRVNMTFPTSVTRTSDSSISVCSSLLLTAIETRVEIVLGLRGVSTSDGLDFVIQPDARVVYGETFNTGKMGEFLTTHLGEKVVDRLADSPSWSDVVVDLHERLIARGRK
ncbi:Kinetochore protein spc7 like [Verticillium longisporum]|uniref:Kinetochore protein spc7 like n=1 Tax=Verticillium longisporum TaxID=100787 RepID=A0A8I2ZRB4_VERLO|nr:Kinetochore protein spc7 like [Verticillium longisporum]